MEYANKFAKIVREQCKKMAHIKKNSTFAADLTLKKRNEYEENANRVRFFA